MDATEFGRVFNGVSLYMKGTFDAEKYHWKTKQTPRGLSKPSVADCIRDEYEARVFALACAFLNIDWWGLTKAHCNIKVDWMQRIQYPQKAVDQIVSMRHLTFEELITDKASGSPLQQMLVSGEIHFVTFAYIVLTTHCTKNWQTLYWKTQKEKLLKIIRGLDIDTGNILQFASLLRKELQ